MYCSNVEIVLQAKRHPTKLSSASSLAAAPGGDDNFGGGRHRDCQTTAATRPPVGADGHLGGSRTFPSCDDPEKRTSGPFSGSLLTSRHRAPSSRIIMGRRVAAEGAGAVTAPLSWERIVPVASRGEE